MYFDFILIFDRSLRKVTAELSFGFHSRTFQKKTDFFQKTGNCPKTHHQFRATEMTSLESVDEPTVYVIHENDEWLVPLRAAFHELGVPFIEW